LQKGGVVGIDLKDDELAFNYGPVERKSGESPSRNKEKEAMVV
jgi:hypothetical protein